MEMNTQRQLIDFLSKEMSIPTSSLEMALRRCNASVGILPMVLWQYGLIDLEQLGKVLDWLDGLY
jgi:hypothetical protein